MAVWISTDALGNAIGTDLDILLSRSANAGGTWTPPVPLNTNAATDSGDDGSPQLTTDGPGHWIAVWGSNHDLGGAIGTDSDILFASSIDQGAS